MDHNHFTGEYRGAAHNQCNFDCQKPKILPVIFHNLQGYDAYLFIKFYHQVGKLDGKIKCICSTEEKYISFSKKAKVDEYTESKTQKKKPIYFEKRFIDTLKFMQTSLANLVKNLQSDEFNHLKKIYKTNTNLLTRKGVYPYDYVNSVDKFQEKKLPPIKEFYSKLNDENNSQEDYNHVQNAFKTFNCKIIKDYRNLYL